MKILLHSVIITINLIFCECTGIFHEKSKIVFRPDRDYSQYFGYTVLLTSNKLIVGAPLAQYSYRNVTSGFIYFCPLTNLDNKNITCYPLGHDNDIQSRLSRRLILNADFIRDDMWFGATIGVIPNGKLMMCAPRWKRDYKDTHYLSNGACYMLSKRTSSILYPLQENNRQAYKTSGLRKEYGEYGIHQNFYAYGQAGFSMKVTNESVILGAPGLLQWTGGVVGYSYLPETEHVSLQQISNPYFTYELGPDNYFGYSVESGIFEPNGSTLYVAGAPRSKGGYGQVLIFSPPVLETEALHIKAKVQGPQLGAYFGGALCCVDINGDGLSDLLVGAPNFVKKDGGLHYDQGAVFVYLTKTNEENNNTFILSPVDYVTGSSNSGNRFGSTIASLGDVNGDGFNDIAIGAPWEDDGKGAVYIFKGEKTGLSPQYLQKIMVKDSKSLGYSISTGLDMNGDNCNELSIGAFSTNAAYVFPCIPSLHVETAIYVPDVTNLPQNATKFTVLFCVKASQLKTWSHVKKDFKVKIIIDPKENRAYIKGDSEFNVSIFAGTENCDQQVVELKDGRGSAPITETAYRPTVDLSRPISMKLKLEENEEWKDSTSIPPHAARLSDDSMLHSSFDIQLMNDCGEDLICKPWLIMSLQPLNSTYVPGTDDKLGVKVSIFNKEEPSFGAKIYLTLPYPPKRLPRECSLEQLNVTCALPAPLKRAETVEYEIELEFIKIHKDITEEIKVLAILNDPMYNEMDIEKRVQEQVIKITPRADFVVNGRALPNTTLAVTRDKLSEAANVTMQHYYEITNLGPSDCLHLRLLINLPDKVNLSSGIKGCSKSGAECEWMMPAKVSQSIILPLKFDLGVHGDFLVEKLEYNITTVIILEGKNKSASVTTTLILEPSPPIWPIIVGSVAGLVLLCLITLTLYKCGFFSRKRLEDFQRLQEQEMSTGECSSEEVQNEFTAEVSSQELILDDSD